MTTTLTASLDEQVPPDERFWRRYSPHGEMPISTVASVTVHGLVLGGLLLFGAYLTSVLFKSDRPLPVEPVRLDLGSPGDGKPGSEPGAAVIGLKEIDGDDKVEAPSKDDVPPRPALNAIERQRVKEEFTPEVVQDFARKDTDQVRAFLRLEQLARQKLSEGLTRGKGRGGEGKGAGQGPGEGNGKGPGKRKAMLTPREKRMLRWHMHFPAGSAHEYLRQLHELGAIVAIPKTTAGGAPQYQIVEDLRARPARLRDADLATFGRIYWIDDKPKSVLEVMAELDVARRPERFLALLPLELEKRLFQMEQDHVTKVMRLPFDENRIRETHFHFNPSRPGKVELTRVTLDRSR